jgi:prepilin-type N-terminal cleavage/methylation domain-containing protein
MKKINKKGFTLIELLVVIAIIGLLSTLAVVSLNSARLKARDARRQSDLRQISTAMELYRTQTDSYPISSGVACDTTDAATIAGTKDLGGTTFDIICPAKGLVDAAGNKYIQSVPIDPTQDVTYHYLYVPGSTPANSYCIQAHLEQTQTSGGATYNFFTCTNGSCVLDADGC